MLTIKNIKKNGLVMLSAGALALLSIGTGFAATPDGSRPDNALIPTTQQTVDAGESVWYAFDYQLDVDGSSPAINISLDGYPDEGTNFEVWTPQLLQQYAGDAQVEPIGRGSENDYVAGDTSWTGDFVEAGTYYVRVSNESVTSNDHVLSVTGDGVILPQIPTNEAEDEAIAETEAAEASVGTQTEPSASESSSESKMDAADGSSPAHALKATGEWTELAANTGVWYAFEYTYDADDRIHAQAWLNSVPDNGIHFEVWTPQQLQQQDDESEPIGRGSQDDNTVGDYFWTGSFNQSGTYYVLVTNDNPTVGYYQLNINSGN